MTAPEDRADEDCEYGEPVSVMREDFEYRVFPTAAEGKILTSQEDITTVVDAMESVRILAQGFPNYEQVPTSVDVYICPHSGSADINSVEIDLGPFNTGPRKMWTAMHEFGHFLDYHLVGDQSDSFSEMSADLWASAASQDLSLATDAILEIFLGMYTEYPADFKGITGQKTYSEEGRALVEDWTREENIARDFASGTDAPPGDDGDHTFAGPTVNAIGQRWLECKTQGFDIRTELLKATSEVRRSIDSEMPAGDWRATNDWFIEKLVTLLSPLPC